MLPIRLVEKGVDVSALREALVAHPEYWDQNTMRTENPTSPHFQLSDVWARYAAPGVDGSKPHKSVWYPCCDVLPVRELALPLFERVGGKELGGVLITKIKAGREVKPHTDPGWHARYYEKFAISIQAAPGQVFRFDNAELETEPGDVFWFDNSQIHSVTNPTPHDRITMIVCIRRVS